MHERPKGQACETSALMRLLTSGARCMQSKVSGEGVKQEGESTAAQERHGSLLAARVRVRTRARHGTSEGFHCAGSNVPPAGMGGGESEAPHAQSHTGRCSAAVSGPISHQAGSLVLSCVP